jgi:O-antigen/teichoic acid export membrane protein
LWCDQALSDSPRSNWKTVFSRLKRSLAEDNRLRYILRGAASVMLTRAAGAALAYATQVLLARWAGAHEFGIFVYAWLWAAVLGEVAPLGMSGAVVRLVPEYMARKDFARVLGVATYGRTVTLSVGAVIALSFAAIVLSTRDSTPTHYVPPLLLVSACLPLYALVQLHTELLRSFGWVVSAYISPFIVRPGALLVVAALILAAYGRPSGVQLMAAALISCVLTVAVQIYLLRRKLPAVVRQAKAKLEKARWLHIAFPMLMTQCFYLALAFTDVLFLGIFYDPATVGIYNAAARTAGMMSFIVYAVAALAAPQFAALHAERMTTEIKRLKARVVHWVFWPSLLLAGFLLITGRYVLGLFGAEFVAGYAALAILLVGYLATAATGVAGQLLNMTGHQVAVAVALGSAAILNVILNLALIPGFGVIGAAAATAFSMTAFAIGLAVITKRRLGFHAFVFLRA